MKKILALILTIVMLILSQSSVMAEKTTYDDALFDITSLGIFVPDENGGYREGSPLTRAEFATAILRMIGYDEIVSVGVATSFADVAEEDWYYNAVQNVYSLNIMTGDGKGYFHPTANVTLEEAVKTVVTILGYEISAENLGGWPQGYMAMATKLGVLDGLKTSGVFTRGDLAVVLYNALDVQILTKRYGSEEFYKDSDTYRYLLMRKYGKKVYNVVDVVKATAFSYTEFPIKDLEEDEVVIGDIRYKKGSTDVDNYIGMEVEIFAVEYPEGTTTLLSVKPTGNNTVTEIALADIEGCSNSYVNYTSGNKTEKINFEALPVMLYNGTPVEFNKNELLSENPGCIKFVDCNNNKKVDYIFIEAYENILVQRVSENVIVPYNGFTVNGKKTLFVDLENENKKFEIYDGNGEIAQFTDIKPEQILSVYSDKNETRFRIYLSDKTGTGVFSEYDENTVKIDDNTYNVYSKTVYDGELGDEVTVYIDAKGYCAYIKYVPQTKNYGYVLDVWESGFTKEVALLLSKPASFTADINSEDLDNITSTPVLICENEGIEYYSLAKKVKINGQRYSQGDAIEKLQNAGAVKFSLNSEGLISEAEILEMYAGDESLKLTYNVYDKVFAGNSFIEGFSLDEKSNIICIPEIVKREDDYLVKTRIDVSGNTEGYNVRAYDYDEVTKKAGLVVIVKGMDAELINDATITSSPACMVKNVRVVCDEDNGDYYRLTLIENGKEVTYNTIEVREKNEVISELRPGDLISYYMNDSDLIENVMLFHSFKNGDSSYKIQHATRDYVEYCGIIEDVSFDEVDNTNCLLATKVVMEIQGGSVPLYIQQRNKPPVFIYDFSGEEMVQSSSLEELIPGYDKLYVLSVSNKTPRACVIIRGE